MKKGDKIIVNKGKVDEFTGIIEDVRVLVFSCETRNEVFINGDWIDEHDVEVLHSLCACRDECKIYYPGEDGCILKDKCNGFVAE